MTDTLDYKVELGVDDNPDIDEIEELLQDILMDLYDQGDVDSIRVRKKNYPADMRDDDVTKMIEIVDGLDSEAIRKAIECARVLQDMDSDDER